MNMSAFFYKADELLNIEIDGLYQLVVQVQIDFVLPNRPGICGTAKAEVISIIAACDLNRIDLLVRVISICSNKSPNTLYNGIIRRVIQIEITIKRWCIR